MLSFQPKNVSKELLSDLPDRSRRVLSDRFGLNGKGERRTLDACAADAQARNPSAKGSVTLRLTIEDRKVVNVAVDKDSLHDAQLTSCLVNAGHTLKFTLKQASFYWPVSL